MRRRRNVPDEVSERRLRDRRLGELSLSWRVRERPWEVERGVIALTEPPLNSAGNKAHPFYARVSSARAAFRAAAAR